jgi:hypothetical protein
MRHVMANTPNRWREIGTQAVPRIAIPPPRASGERLGISETGDRGELENSNEHTYRSRKHLAPSLVLGRCSDGSSGVENSHEYNQCGRRWPADVSRYSETRSPPRRVDVHVAHPPAEARKHNLEVSYR